MIRDEAEKLSGSLQERFGAVSGLSCAVKPIAQEVEFNAPGGGRPKIVRYRIVVSGEGREAQLSLDEAEELLASVTADTPAEQVFAQIASLTGSSPTGSSAAGSCAAGASAAGSSAAGAGAAGAGAAVSSAGEPR